MSATDFSSPTSWLWRIYALIWNAFGWLVVPSWLTYRSGRGKEDKARLGERYGRTQIARPAGSLFWVHAASVGEANAILPLVARLLETHPDWHALMTTGTRSSAQLLAEKLPPRALHQYIPLDHPAYVARFLSHWKPDLALWCESELWPNLLLQAKEAGVPLWLVNARMSRKSYRGWSRFPAAAASLLSVFTGIYAGSLRDAEHYAALAGEQSVEFLGNLKYDAPELVCDAQELTRLQEDIGTRPVLLAASLHPGEDLPIAALHKRLKAQWPNLLTILVPRHAPRGEAIAALLRREGLNVAQRSAYESITPHIELYLADTMGELGLFYRLAQVAFIGGSLVPHGGQNPLEPVRLGVPVLTGLYTQNFTQICDILEQAGAMKRVLNLDALVGETALLLTDANLRAQRVQRGQSILAEHGGALERLSARLGAEMDRRAWKNQTRSAA